METGGRLHEIGTSLYSQLAGSYLFLVRQERCLYNDFNQSPARCRIGYGLNIAKNDIVAAGLQRSDIDDHIDLSRAAANRISRLISLRLGSRGAKREADDGAHLHLRTRKLFRGIGYPRRVYTHRCESILLCIVRQLLDIFCRRVRPQQRMINHASYIHNYALLYRLYSVNK
ncbi:hypothetical protein D3C77_374050 [compost metagenome]